MKYSTKTGTLSELRSDCLVASLKAAARVCRSRGVRGVFDAATTDFVDELGKTLLVNLGTGQPIKRVLLVGGLDSPVEPQQFTRAAAAAAAALRHLDGRNVLWALTPTRVEGRDAYWKASTGLAALSRALYAFNEHKTSGGTVIRVNRVGIFADGRSRTAVAKAVRHGQAAKAGIDWARDLGNQPANVCNPTYLLREARKLGRHPKVTVAALDEKKMDELGMGAFLAVSKGSTTPGRMIIVRYHGARSRSAAPIVLIGKGITFDTGGISIKPSAAMDEMKFDMCGAATVLGATRAAVEAGLPINIVTMVAAAENMPSGVATRPGDIVTTYAGKTVEILNTDAEGRLVLCDALAYATRYKPAAVVDVATLTGACIVALGRHASALYANNDELAESLVAAGEASGDRVWRMPLWDEYQSALKSPFADIANIGSGGAGSITAACFLSRFAEKQRWAHLDVAGSAFEGGASKGATGRPTGLLFRYLIDQAGA